MESTLAIVLMLVSVIVMITIIIMIGVVLYKVFPKTLPTPVESHPKSIKNASLYDAEIYKMLCKLQQTTQACKVVVARFHNGGSYRNGLDMEKFSITHETQLGSTVPLQDKCVSVLNSRYGSAFLHLATLGEYCISDIEDCPDPNFKQDMKFYGFSATYLFLIKQFDNSDEGFLGLNFKQTTVLTQEQKDKVRASIVRLVGLINMKESFLKEK